MLQQLRCSRILQQSYTNALTGSNPTMQRLTRIIYWLEYKEENSGKTKNAGKWNQSCLPAFV
jgi:hypothetical protein